MSEKDAPLWLRWAREIQSLSQTGLAYASTDYDMKRYRRLMEISAEIVESYTNLDKTQLSNNFFSQPGYATPKIDVRGAVIRNGQILLVQERRDMRWCMPGGWADVGELPSHSIIRETREESGFDVEPRKLIGVYDANRGPKPVEFYHAYKIIFLCDIVRGEARSSDETSDVQFFSFDNLPPLSTFRTNNRHIADIQVHLANEASPAAFD
ncbi:MAG: NUDIX hydrolase [Thermodesulfobacteriota bacterium]